MIALAFILAALLIITSVVLLIVDQRRGHTARTPETLATAQQSPETQEPAPNSEEAPQSNGQSEVPEENEPEATSDVAADAEGHSADATAEFGQGEFEETCSSDARAAESNGGLGSETSEVARSTHETDQASFIGAESESVESAAPKNLASEGTPNVAIAVGAPESAGPFSQAKVRKSRRQWASARNAEYRRVDHELAAQWVRTPAGDAKGVVSGFSHGREMHVCTLAGNTVIALRRSLGSDEVWELAHSRASIGTDVELVAKEAGLFVAATTPEIIHRIFDDRANKLLTIIPDYIYSMWSENDWSVAELPSTSTPAQWEETLNVLAEFSNISRRLPPKESEMPTIDESQWDPTRSQLCHQTQNPGARGGLQVVGSGENASKSTVGVPEQAASLHDADLDKNGSATTDAEQVETVAAGSAWRPQKEHDLESIKLPSRSVPKRMGSLGQETSPRPENDIPALGEDPEHTHAHLRGSRIIRSNQAPSSIFSDGKVEDENSVRFAHDSAERTDERGKHSAAEMDEKDSGR